MCSLTIAKLMESFLSCNILTFLQQNLNTVFAKVSLPLSKNRVTDTMSYIITIMNFYIHAVIKYN